MYCESLVEQKLREEMDFEKKMGRFQHRAVPWRPADLGSLPKN
jgi:hypothetical protein